MQMRGERKGRRNKPYFLVETAELGERRNRPYFTVETAEEVGSTDERGTKGKKKQALFYSGNRGTRRKNRPYFTVETAKDMLTSVGYQGTVMVPEAR